MNRIFFVILGFLILAGCTATTTLSSVQPASIIDIKDAKKTGNPRSESLSTTSFGNYEFKISNGTEKQFFGILPLKFNGGYLALDILFFAPAAFFNLREVFPYYEFDLEKSIVRYKEGMNDPWIVYSPTTTEADRAKAHFSAKQ